MRLDSLTAEEALRMARATLDCGDQLLITGAVVPGSQCGDPGEYGDLYRAPETGGLVESHALVASAVLDGFSVDEVTEAGG